MLLTQDQALERLQNPKNLALRFGKSVKDQSVSESVSQPVSESASQDKVQIDQAERTGKKAGSTDVPIAMRNVISILGNSGVDQPKLAKEFGITQASVSGYERGKSGVDKDLVADKVNEIKDLALTKLMSSLGLLTDEKMAKCRAVEISTVSANLSRIVEKVSPKSSDGVQVNLTIYAPALRDEKGYKVVDV